MIRVRVIDGYSSVVSRRKMEQVKDIFRVSFPHLADIADDLPGKLKDPVNSGYNSKLLIIEKGQHVVLGFAFVVHFPAIQVSFLDFFAVRPGQRGGGVGGSMYEAVQEHCRQNGSHSVYIDVVPDDPAVTVDSTKLDAARKRIIFYERYGARVVVNPPYSRPVGDPPLYSMLLMDRLGRDDVPTVEEIKTALSRIFMRIFPTSSSVDYISHVFEYFEQNGVNVRPLLREPSRNWHAARPGKLDDKFSLIYNPKHEIHHLQEKGYLESPVRMQAIMDALDGSPLFDVIPVQKDNETTIHEVHSADLVQFLRVVCSNLNEASPFYPDTFPIRRPDKRPRNVSQQAGYYCLDDGTPLYKGAYVAARAALDTAITGADEILAGKRLAYAVCRPPGHHAGHNFFGGFCYFNNAAAAAQHLSHQFRTAILDIDYHHGNGTQDIFYKRPDVLTLSLHGDPTYSYPYFSGFETEIGEGEGKGFNQNFPMPLGTGDMVYLRMLDKALRRIREFRADIVVISLGYDILKGDPTGDFVLSFESMGKIAGRLKDLGVPLLVVQEGGYHLNNIRRGCEAFFQAFDTSVRVPIVGLHEEGERKKT